MIFLLRAARGEKVERTPVWMMRQAGRILAEYRAVREKAGSFIKLATTPEMAAEVTLQPVDLLGVDAAIIFSDILVIPEAMGLPYEMIEQRGTFFPLDSSYGRRSSETTHCGAGNRSEIRSGCNKIDKAGAGKPHSADRFCRCAFHDFLLHDGRKRLQDFFSCQEALVCRS
jgi:hypothetical protein